MWGVWAAMCGAGLYLLARYGRSVPYWDEWELVPYLTGNEPVTATYLWSLHSDHRIPLPRLIYLALGTLTGNELRTPMLFNLAMLATVSAVSILAVRRARGRTRVADAFFPLALLHWGHAENLLWGYGLPFVVSSSLTCILLLAIADWSPAHASRGRITLLGCCLVGLVLSSVNGLIVAAVLLPWVVYAGLACSRSRAPAGALMLVVAGITATVIGGYFTGFHLDAVHPWTRKPVEALACTAAFMSTSLGFAGRALWPLSAATVIIFWVAAVCLLLFVIRARSLERVRAIGLLLGLAGLVAVALGVGWARAGDEVEAGFASRYAILAAPLLFGTYLVWTRYLPGRVAATGQLCLFAALCVATPYNFRDGARFAAARSSTLRAFENDLAAGIPFDLAGERHASTIFPNASVLAGRLEMLRAARAGPFRSVEGPDRPAKPAYPMFRTAPEVVNSLVAVAAQTAGGREVLMVHAPGELRFRLRAGGGRLRGWFGILPSAYLGGQSDGVEFSVDRVAGTDGHVVQLFARFLDPLRVETDRGLQPLDVPIAADADGELVLRTKPGPADDAKWDWSFWSDIEVAGAES